MRAMQSCLSTPHDFIDIYISDANMSLWKIVMQMQPDSLYGDAAFLLYLQIGDDFPAFAPEVRFLTPIYHPNINQHGKVCHAILTRAWTNDTNLTDVLNCIYGLLLVPEKSDSINAIASSNFLWDEVQFKISAQEHAKEDEGGVEEGDYGYCY